MMEKKKEGHDAGLQLNDCGEETATIAVFTRRWRVRPALFSASHRYVNATILGCDFADIHHSLSLPEDPETFFLGSVCYSRSQWLRWHLYFGLRPGLFAG